MILETLGIVTAAAAVIQTARRGVPVSSGAVGDPATGGEVKWRARWAIWRWIAEVRSPSVGWMAVGEFSTKGIARANAIAAAQSYIPTLRTGRPRRAMRVR